MHENLEPTALAIRTESAPAIGDHKPLRYSLPELKSIGEIMFNSGMFKDLRSVQQAMVKLLAGAELGYGPFQSLRAFHVIEGKPVETSGEITARIKRSGKYRLESYFIDVAGNHLDPIKTKASETNGCVVLISEKRGAEWFDLEPTVFTKEDAAAAGLLGKAVWKNYLRDMLFSRTITAAARRHCADIFGGPIYTPEEFGAEVSVDSNGDQVIEGSFTPTPPAPAAAPPPPPADDARQKLLARIHIMTKERNVTRALYLSTLDELNECDRFEQRYEWPLAKSGEVEPTSKLLSVADLRVVIETLSERTAAESEAASG